MLQSQAWFYQGTVNHFCYVRYWKSESRLEGVLVFSYLCFPLYLQINQAWEKWRGQITKLDCSAFWIQCHHVQTREGLKSLLQILLGNMNSLLAATSHWLELCISHFLYIRPFTAVISIYFLSERTKLNLIISLLMYFLVGVLYGSSWLEGSNCLLNSGARKHVQPISEVYPVETYVQFSQVDESHNWNSWRKHWGYDYSSDCTCMYLCNLVSLQTSYSFF